MLGPADMVAALERGADLPSGEEERFKGYGLVGLPFKSGHFLGLRRGTFIQDARPQLACTRYFRSAVSQYLSSDIVISWTGQWDFLVDIAGAYSVHWQASLHETFSSRMLNVLGGLILDFFGDGRPFSEGLAAWAASF